MRDLEPLPPHPVLPMSPKDLFQQGVASGDPAPPKPHLSLQRRLAGGEEFWPAGGAVAAVSSCVRIQEAGKPGVRDPARRCAMSEGENRPSEGSPQAGVVTVSDVQELIRRKEEIEAQIKANYEVLESVSVGSGLPAACV